MNKTNAIEHTDDFYIQLASKGWTTIALIAGLAILSIWGLPFLLDSFWLSWIILLFAFVKAFFIVKLSFKQLMKIINQSHLLSHILVLFGLLISMIITSFAFDFTSLQFFAPESFKSSLNIESSSTKVFFEYLYFSTITFSSVGYGDIFPTSLIAKMLVILEVVLRFFVLVFGIANVNRIGVNK